MTAQNWLMISPMLLLLLVAVALIPVVTKANKKYAKLVAVQRRVRNEAAHGINVDGATDKEKLSEIASKLAENFRKEMKAPYDMAEAEALASQPHDIEGLRRKFLTMKAGRDFATASHPIFVHYVVGSGDATENERMSFADSHRPSGKKTT